MRYKINIFVKVLLQRLFTVSKRTSYCCGIAKNIITIEKTCALVCKGLPALFCKPTIDTKTALSHKGS